MLLRKTITNILLIVKLLIWNGQDSLYWELYWNIPWFCYYSLVILPHDQADPEKRLQSASVLCDYYLLFRLISKKFPVVFMSPA